MLILLGREGAGGVGKLEAGRMSQSGQTSRAAIVLKTRTADFYSSNTLFDVQVQPTLHTIAIHMNNLIHICLGTFGAKLQHDH